MTPAGIESATFRFVAQHLNHCAKAVKYEEKRKTRVLFQNIGGKNKNFQGVSVGYISKFAHVQPQTREVAHKFGASLEESAIFNGRKYFEEILDFKLSPCSEYSMFSFA